jgi:NAD-reducing hydrogenase large subunit
MRKYGQEIIEATAGKKIHGTGAIPGGINRNLPIERRDALPEHDRRDARMGTGRGQACRDYTLEHEDLVPSSDHSRRTTCRSCVRRRRARSLSRQSARADSTGDEIFDKVPIYAVSRASVEDVRSWSYMKFPFIKELGPEDGWYRVGPLARMNTASFIDTPLANAALEELKSATNGHPNNSTLANHWARMIEVVHCVEKIRELLLDPDLQGTIWS